jgi:elongation factor P
MNVTLALYKGSPISVDLPTAVEMEITYTEPGVRGDRVSAATKPATTQTGLVVAVPLFVNIGDKIRVDTRSGNYLTRV